jgi:hypothetical protein
MSYIQTKEHQQFHIPPARVLPSTCLILYVVSPTSTLYLTPTPRWSGIVSFCQKVGKIGAGILYTRPPNSENAPTNTDTFLRLYLVSPSCNTPHDSLHLTNRIMLYNKLHSISIAIISHIVYLCFSYPIIMYRVNNSTHNILYNTIRPFQLKRKHKFPCRNISHTDVSPSIIHQPLIDVGGTKFRQKGWKSVRESCIRDPQTRRTPLQTQVSFPFPTLQSYNIPSLRLHYTNNPTTFSTLKYHRRSYKHRTQIT